MPDALSVMVNKGVADASYSVRCCWRIDTEARTDVAQYVELGLC